MATSGGTGADWADRISANLLRRVERDRSARARRAASGRAAARQLAERLSREPGVRKVVLFGSLAGPGGLVHELSDIDLAVEGLADTREAAVAAELAQIAGMHLDLIRIERASPALRSRIEEDGEVLYVAR